MGKGQKKDQCRNKRPTGQEVELYQRENNMLDGVKIRTHQAIKYNFDVRIILSLTQWRINRWRKNSLPFLYLCVSCYANQ